MFDSSLITYAVSLHFSQKVNEIVISTLQDIADETGNRFMIENKIPPHITIGAFHAAREESLPFPDKQGSPYPAASRI